MIESTGEYLTLPNISTEEQIKALDRRNSVFEDATRMILAKNGITVDTIVAPTTGSCPVTIANDRIVTKFFAPIYFEETAKERDALLTLSRLPGCAPRLIDDGELDGWGYVVMEKLRGKSLAEWWPELTEQERSESSREIGYRLRALHELTQSRSSSDRRTWDMFLSKQANGAAERQRRLGLREKLTDQIEPFLSSVALPVPESLSLLHTEVMREHLFFDRNGDHLAFAGFIDFEPSMVGAPEYEFASFGLFVSSGSRTVFRSVCEGYGVLEPADESFQRRIMAYTLLHRYANLPWYLEFMPNGESFDELASLWWGV